MNSQRAIYQKIMDIYATAVDYTLDSKTTRDFWPRCRTKCTMLYMADWVDKLDAFRQFNEAEILHDKGKVSAAIAKAFAESEFEQYRVLQDKAYVSDFDRLMLEAENTSLDK